MSAEKEADRTPETGHADQEGGGLLPAILVGAGILVVAALLIFDFGGKDGEATEAGGGDKAAAAQAGGPAAGAGKQHGVQSRPYDAAQGRRESKINPAIRLPNVGMAQSAPPKPDEIPEFADTAEEIAFYEKRLASAIRTRDDRKKFVERLPKVKERIETGPNAEAGLKTFEGRKKIVEDNYDQAIQKVEELEAKLAALRGS